MAQTIKIKRSSTSGNKLTSSNSIAGELGLNTADKALYIQTGSDNGDVVTVAHESTLKIDEANNRVGIGTTSPAYPLHISGSGSQRLRIQKTDAGGDCDIQLYSPSDSTQWILFGDSTSGNNSGVIKYVHSTNKMHFRTNDVNDRLVISSDGNIGIGTDSPAHPLHVLGTGNNHQIRVERTGTGKVNLGVDTVGAFVEAQTSIPLRFYESNAERVRLTSGKVIIGDNASHTDDYFKLRLLRLAAVTVYKLDAMTRMAIKTSEQSHSATTPPQI